MSETNFDELTDDEIDDLEWKQWMIKEFPVDLKEQFKKHCKKWDYTIPYMLVKLVKKELSRKKLKKRKMG